MPKNRKHLTLDIEKARAHSAPRESGENVASEFNDEEYAIGGIAAPDGLDDAYIAAIEELNGEEARAPEALPQALIDGFRHGSPAAPPGPHAAEFDTPNTTDIKRLSHPQGHALARHSGRLSDKILKRRLTHNIDSEGNRAPHGGRSSRFGSQIDMRAAAIVAQGEALRRITDTRAKIDSLVGAYTASRSDNFRAVRDVKQKSKLASKEERVAMGTRVRDTIGELKEAKDALSKPGTELKMAVTFKDKEDFKRAKTPVSPPEILFPARIAFYLDRINPDAVSFVTNSQTDASPLLDDTPLTRIAAVFQHEGPQRARRFPEEADDDLLIWTLFPTTGQSDDADAADAEFD